jgi:hypothetical protein
MGMYDQFDPDDLPEDPEPERGADGRKQNDRAPLEGEIVFTPHPRRAYRRNSKGQRDYDEEFIREVIEYSIANPREGLRKRADRFGVSTESIRRWTQAEVARRQAADVAKLRAEASMQLHAARNEAWGIVGDARAQHRLRYALDGLALVNHLTTTDAKLMGLNMPVRLDVQVTELTEAERELQEIVREAQAKAAADEARVIAQADADPDL